MGAGPRLDAIQAIARAHGLADRVEFLGHRDDVPSLLAEADLFVLPSRTEALPNGVIEAMAAGLPVVAGAVGGLLDLIEDGRTGVLVPPLDCHALAAALRGLLSNPARAAALGCAAQQEVRRRFSFERMVAAFESLYLSALQARTLDVRNAETAGV